MRKLIIIFLFAIFNAVPAHATISLNHISYFTSSGSTITTTVGNGPYVVVIVSDPSRVITGCSDSKSNSYTLSTTHATSTQQVIWLCNAFSTTSGATTISYTSTGSGGIGGVFYDCSSATGGAIDSTSGVVAYNAQSSTSGNISVTAAGAGFAVFGMGGANVTGVTVFTQDSISSGGINTYAAAGHDTNGSGGALNPVCSFFNGNTFTWSALIVEFKEASGVVKHGPPGIMR